jgi:hypothetical protein
MNTDPLTIRVECCYAGYRGEETPRRFLGDKSIEIEEVIDRWLALEYRLHLSRFLYAISRI